MADYLSRAFRLQLTTAMETVIRTAVIEITQIFENSLHDHQMELARKGEEIAHLIVKLQRAEIKLRDILGVGGMDIIKDQTKETQKESEGSSPQQQSNDPEIDDKVPNDWCVPLGTDNVGKQEDFCPSVRLRQFSIPLWPISIKNEKNYHKIDEPRLRRRYKKGLKKNTTDKSSPKIVRRSHRNVVNSSEMKVVSPMQTKGSLEKETSKVKAKMIFQCRFCSEAFKTEFGCSVHERSHRKCRGCKRIFPFPCLLRRHKVNCAKYSKLMLRVDKPSSMSPIKSISKQNTWSKKQMSEKDKPFLKQRTSLAKKHLKSYTCSQCTKKFPLYGELQKHTCIYSCGMCPKTFPTRTSLKIHASKKHKELTETRSDLSWTKPLEEIEDSNDNVLSAILSAMPKIKECPGGFRCLFCMQIYSSKNSAIEHIFTHTGERPFKCDYCTATFRHRSAQSIHKRKAHGAQMKKKIICVCGKRFSIKSKYKDHKLNCQKADKPVGIKTK